MPVCVVVTSRDRLPYRLSRRPCAPSDAPARVREECPHASSQPGRRVLSPTQENWADSAVSLKALPTYDELTENPDELG